MTCRRWAYAPAELVLAALLWLRRGPAAASWPCSCTACWCVGACQTAVARIAHARSARRCMAMLVRRDGDEREIKRPKVVYMTSRIPAKCRCKQVWERQDSLQKLRHLSAFKSWRFFPKTQH
jgi:hypothetical protein